MARRTRSYPFVFDTSGTHHLVADQDFNGTGGTLVQFSWNGTGNAQILLQANQAAGIEPINLTPIGFVDRSTGYFTQPSPNNYIGETQMPFCAEVVSPTMDLYMTLTLTSGATVTAMCLPAVQSVLRPAGASLFDLNFDQVPAAADEDLEMGFASAVATYNNN